MVPLTAGRVFDRSFLLKLNHMKNRMLDIKETYKETTLFEGLEPQQLDDLVSNSVVRKFSKNTMVVHQGDETDSLYVIIEGNVDVFLQNESGKEIIINSLGPCDSFGELAPLGHIPRQASIITKTDCVFSVISRSVFMDSLLTSPSVSMKIIEILVKCIQDLTSDLSSVALDDVYHRVVRVLYKYSDDVDGKVVTERLTQQDIANRVGATREMVHRILKELKTGGYISIDGKHITIEKKLPPGW